MTSADAFNQDLNGWDVGSVTDMQRSFQSAGRFNGLVADWDVSVVTDMGAMFNHACEFAATNLSRWNVSRVELGDAVFAAGDCAVETCTKSHIYHTWTALNPNFENWLADWSLVPFCIVRDVPIEPKRLRSPRSHCTEASASCRVLTVPAATNLATGTAAAVRAGQDHR